MAPAKGSVLGARRTQPEPSRHALWEAVATGLRDLLDAPAGTAPTAGATCAARLGNWVGHQVPLEDGGVADRALVEALVEAESAMLVHSGESPATVAVAGDRFAALCFEPLVPPAAAGGER